MTPREAVLAWFKAGNASADILQTDFVVFFAESTGNTAVWQTIGAPKVKGAGAALSALCKEGVLERGRIGIGGVGWPKWVYGYTMKQGATT